MAGALLVGAIAWMYGVVPFSGHTFALPLVASMSGWTDCLGDGLWPCTYVGYPEGVDLSVSLPLVGGVYLLREVGLGVEDAINVVALAALIAGFAAMWSLTAAITRRRWAGALGATLYVLSPLLVTHTDKTGLWLGFVLLPVPVRLAYAAVAPRADEPRRPLVRALLSAGAVFVSALVIVYLDPYAWTIATVLCLPMCVVAGALAARRRRWSALVVSGLTLAAVMVPGVVFRLGEPSAKASSGFPPEFYRAFGADLVTTIVPTQDSLLWDALRLPVQPWDPTQFRGDGTQLVGAYLGVFTLVAAVAGAVHLLRRREADRPVLAGLIVGGLTCLVLGLGPSLKVHDTAHVAPTDSPYQMAASEATASLPWSGIYGVQPFEGMRAAYRWHAGARLVLVVLATAAVLMVWLKLRRSGRIVVALALSAVLVLDMSSHALVRARGQARDNHVAYAALVDDIDRELGRGQLSPGERVLFLPAANDYLIMAIAPQLEVFSYNASFDKEMARIRAHQPLSVQRVIWGYDHRQVTPELVCEVFRSDAADAVVFTNFSMRADSTDWPPDQARIQEWRTRNQAIGLADDPAFSVEESDLVTVVRPADGALGGGC